MRYTKEKGDYMNGRSFPEGGVDENRLKGEVACVGDNDIHDLHNHTVTSFWERHFFYVPNTFRMGPSRIKYFEKGQN